MAILYAAQAADLLNVSSVTIRNWIKKYNIGHKNNVGKYIVNLDALKKLASYDDIKAGDYITPNIAAKISGYTCRTMIKWAGLNKIKSIKFGERILIDRVDLLKYLKTLEKDYI